MNFNNPICPLLHLFLLPHHHHPRLSLSLHLHPFFPEGRIRRWGSCVCVCVCKVVVYGRGLYFSFPSCASLTQLLVPSQAIHLSVSSSSPPLFLSPLTLLLRWL